MYATSVPLDVNVTVAQTSIMAQFLQESVFCWLERFRKMEIAPENELFFLEQPQLGDSPTLRTASFVGQSTQH
jgi:hypothetical protein